MKQWTTATEEQKRKIKKMYYQHEKDFLIEEHKEQRKKLQDRYKRVFFRLKIAYTNKRHEIEERLREEKAVLREKQRQERRKQS